MEAPITLIILVAVGMAGDPTTVAMSGAARATFGDALVEVREIRGDPSEQAATIEARVHPDAVAEVEWSGAGHGEARLRVHVPASGRWIERTFYFGRGDGLAQRGRTLGFALAAMIPEPVGKHALIPQNSAGSPLAPSPVPRPPTSLADHVSTAESTGAGSQPGIPIREEVRPYEGPSRPEYIRATSPVAFELVGLGALGMVGAAQGSGGMSLGADWFAMPRVALRLSGAFRVGGLRTPDVRTILLSGSAGIEWQISPVSPSRPIGMSVRADYVLEFTSVTYQSDAHSFQPISGADTFVDARWQFSPGAVAFVGLGLEDLFGSIALRSSQAITLPSMSVLTEAGAQLRF